MTDEKIARINALAKRNQRRKALPRRKSRATGAPRGIYRGFPKNLKSQLDNTVVINPDGTSYRLRQDKGDK